MQNSNYENDKRKSFSQYYDEKKEILMQDARE